MNSESPRTDGGERGSARLPDVAATHALAAELARALAPGDVLALVGDLGAGKTEFTRGLAAALGVPADAGVCSPSYLLLNLYAGGRVPLAHFDAYFLREADDLQRAGLDDLRRQGAVAVVEWADRVADALPADALWLELTALHGAGPADTVRLACWSRGAPPVAAGEPQVAAGDAPVAAGGAGGAGGARGGAGEARGGATPAGSGR
ncbi:MAG TPA: tRNA (adenosine(37)-N6)-threonylcarbamoyltransferase complex ATPase subunit type 1 TsaE [Planctomycetota bacterium]|nr:tRNA (adenosine(37)-N6)-threonylcarbamoyltransferase complex ATPase subunit type 1 TsaE [Planctomycetota bacterium]